MSKTWVQELNGILDDYSKEVMGTVEGCSSAIAKDTVKKLKRVRFHTGGEYSKTWAVKEESGVLGSKSYIVYNKKNYRLTHLLEYGHVTRNGTKRTRAIPHIKPMEEWVQNQLPKDIMQKLGGK